MAVITVTPDKDGRLFIRLFGEDYEIVVKTKGSKKTAEKTDEPAAE